MLTRREQRAQAPVDPATIPPPKDAVTSPQDEINRESFSFPTVKRFTSFVQYRTDRADVTASGNETWKRGEVKRVLSKRFADSLVATGQFAHVAIGTPLGQPAEFAPKPKSASVPPPAPITNSNEDED